MKNVWIVMLVCVCFIGCDDMSKPAMNVISEAVISPVEPTVEGTPPVETTETVIPELTFENALNLIPGQRYRFRPTGITRSSSGAGDALIWGVEWGNVLSEQFWNMGISPQMPPKSV